ncbi:MAG TPA: HAD family hydrolase [Xanthobacteraceae bacterium]|jgi:HAD superfamily hydrolase (TIGR01509 family)|nr:HAD family hydrolase [Xanthobacteraceae bacterium]
MTLLIFDCDGVLVDSEVIAHQTLLDSIAPLGLTMSLQEAFAVFSGRSLKDTLAIVEQRLGRPLPADFLEQSRKLLFERFRQSLKPVAGVAEAIAALPYARCVASSSSFDRLRLALDVTGLAPVFGEDVFSATQVERGKPAPDLFLFAAKQMGARPARCIVIEDSSLGVEAGRAAGMRVIGFAGASHATDALTDRLSAAGADRVIRTMRDLPRCVEALEVTE